MSLRDRLIQHIQQNLAADRHGPPIDERTPLLDEGIIDSMGLMQVVQFIEEQTGVRVPDDEVMPDNFQDATSIEAMVARLQARRG